MPADFFKAWGDRALPRSGADATHPVVLRVRHHEPARPIEREAGRRVQLREPAGA